MKTLRYLLYLLALSCVGTAFPQNAHRISQALARGNAVSVNVVPNAKVKVCVAGTVVITSTGSTCGTYATVYLTPNITTPVPQPIPGITADSAGNYDYYIASGCVDEIISSPGQGAKTLENVCPFSGTSGGGGNVLPAPYGTLYIQPNSGTQAIAGPSSIGTDTTKSALLLNGTNPDNGQQSSILSNLTGNTNQNGVLQTQTITDSQRGWSNGTFAGSQSPQWSITKNTLLNSTWLTRGITEALTMFQDKYAIGDSKALGIFSFYDNGFTAGSDEAHTAIKVNAGQH